MIVVLLVSFYVMVIPSIELCSEKALMKSLVLVGHSGSSFFVTLRMGDTLEVVAEVDDVSNAYFLTIRDDAGEVFSKSGGIDGSSVDVGLSLHSSSFEAGKSYVVFFNVYAFNYPLPGVVISGRGTVGFTVDYSDTRLDFEVDYDGVFRSIGLCANLTNVDGCPVVDEAVSFCTRPVNGRRRRTDGWIPIGSARTNDSGIACLSLAFSVPDGNYSFRALHDGDENFGESENVTTIEAFSNMTDGDFDLSLGSESSFESAFSVWSVGELTIEVSNSTPYALLPMNVSARYSVDLPLEGAVIMYFFLDYMNLTGCFSGVEAEQCYDPPYYVYEGALFWGPEVVGSHKVIVGVINASSSEDIILGQHGIGIVASEEVSLDIQPCPSNMILEYAEATYEDVLPVTVVFSKPRPYQAESTDYYVTTTLAPKIIYNELEYAIDEPVGSIPLKLQKNGTLTSVNLTNGDGVASFALDLSFSDHIALNITSSLNESVTLYEQSVVERVVNFTKISVCDVVTNGSEVFGLNYTICNHEEGSDEIYLGTENPVRAEVDLFGLPLWNAPISFVVAKNSSRCTTSSGSALIPSDSDYLSLLEVYEYLYPSQRVKIRFDTGQEVYVDILGIVRIPLDATNLTVIEEPLIGDVNDDGVVNIVDVTIVTAAYGSRPGDQNWNPLADLNNDGVVNIADLVLVTANYRDDSTLDADLEFFETCLEEESVTNNLGLAVETWEPSEVGRYAVEVKLPSSFNVTLASWSDVTQLNASTGVVGCFYVVKRPLDLSLEYTPSEPTLDDEVTMIANVFDLGLGEPAEGLYVGFCLAGVRESDMEPVWIDLGGNFTNSSGVVTISFVPRPYCEEYDLIPWFYVLALCFETYYTLESELAFVLIDTRYPTRLEFLGDEVIHVPPPPLGQALNLDCKLVRADNGDPVPYSPIQIYLNDTWQDEGFTDDEGDFTFSVTIYESGLYFFRVQFSWGEGWFDPLYKDSNNVTFVIVAEAVPVFVFFEVEPKEFEPDTTVTLSATVFNATSNELLEGIQVWFYWYANNGTMDVVGSDWTGGDGVASVTWLYPESGVFVFWARVSDAQQIISSPVMLTVGLETELSMNIEQGEGFDHVISGVLLCGGDAVVGRQVVIKVNGTVADVVETSGDGSYSSTLTLGPLDNELTDYEVEVVFHGDKALNLTGLATLPNGTEYAVCTTLQYGYELEYGYKPASNTAMLTVEPQSTEVMKTTKTPEELEQEAKESGWFRVEPRFSWWYPWFRLHLKLNVNLPQGNPDIDYGWSFLPFGDSYSADNAVLANILNDVSDDIQTGILVDFMAGMILQFGTAAILGRTLVGIAVAIGMYLAYNIVSAWYLQATSGGKPQAWLAAFITSAFSGTCGAVLAGISSISGVLTSASRLILGKIQAVMHSLWAKGLNFFNITGVVFALIDFAFMVFYLSMYLTSI